jgi:hypothetical protein
MGHHKMGQDDSSGDMNMDEWGDVQPAGVAAARAGDYIVAAASQADVEEIIDVVNGDEGSLADSDAMQQVVDKLPEAALSFTYVDGVGIIDALGPDGEKMLESLAPGMSTDVWRAQAGISISAEDIGFRTDSVAIPGEGGSLDTIVSENDPAIAQAAAEAPAHTLFFEAGKLVEGSLATAPYAIAMAVASSQQANSGNDEMQGLPTEEEIQAQLDSVNQMLGFDLKSDLFDLLGGTFVLFSNFPNFSNAGVSLDAVAAIETSDPAKLAATTQKIADLITQAAPDLKLGERDVDGDTLHVLKVSDTGDVPAIEFGVVGNQLVLGVGSGVDSLVGTPAETLADDPQFQEVMGSLPSEYYQVVYLDINQLTPLFGMLSSMESSDATPAAMNAAGLANIKAFAAVGFRDGDAVGSSAILYIAES